MSLATVTQDYKLPYSPELYFDKFIAFGETNGPLTIPNREKREVFLPVFGKLIVPKYVVFSAAQLQGINPEASAKIYVDAALEDVPDYAAETNFLSLLLHDTVIVTDTVLPPTAEGFHLARDLGVIDAAFEVAWANLGSA